MHSNERLIVIIWNKRRCISLCFELSVWRALVVL